MEKKDSTSASSSLVEYSQCPECSASLSYPIDAYLIQCPSCETKMEVDRPINPIRYRVNSGNSRGKNEAGESHDGSKASSASSSGAGNNTSDENTMNNTKGNGIGRNPATAFMYFRQELLPVVREQHANFTHAMVEEKLKEMWLRMTPLETRPYYNLEASNLSV